MDKLFSWIYNLTSESVPSESEMNVEEIRDSSEQVEGVNETNHLETVNPPQQQVVSPILAQEQDVNMDMEANPHEIIDLISSDEEDGAEDVPPTNPTPLPHHEVIDLTMDDDLPREKHSRLNHTVKTRLQNKSRHIHRLAPYSRKLAKAERGVITVVSAKDMKLSNKLTKQAKRMNKNTEKIKKRRMFALWKRDAIAKTVPGRCWECMYKYTGNDPVLSQERSDGLCNGCFLLHKLALTEGESMNDVFHWLRTGELNVKVWNNEVDNDKEERLVKKRSGNMRTRMNRTAHQIHTVATQEQLYDLYIDSECKCAVTGWTCHFSRDNSQKYWTVTFDHIEPVSVAVIKNPWSISNIQVMCYLMNTIKGNNSDEELRRWFKQWKNTRL